MNTEQASVGVERFTTNNQRVRSSHNWVDFTFEERSHTVSPETLNWILDPVIVDEGDSIMEALACVNATPYDKQCTEAHTTAWLRAYSFRVGGLDFDLNMEFGRYDFAYTREELELLRAGVLAAMGIELVDRAIEILLEPVFGAQMDPEEVSGVLFRPSIGKFVHQHFAEPLVIDLRVLLGPPQIVSATSSAM